MKPLDVEETDHWCQATLPSALHGPAVTECFTDEEARMWVTNEEYASQVNFCPFCGKEAEHGKRGSQEHLAHEAEVNLKKLVKEHDPRETDCTKFLLCIQDGEIRSYDGCHGDEQGVAHAAALIDTLPSGGKDDRRVMLSIDQVPEDGEGMSEDEKRAQQHIPSVD